MFYAMVQYLAQAHSTTPPCRRWKKRDCAEVERTIGNDHEHDAFSPLGVPRRQCRPTRCAMRLSGVHRRRKCGEDSLCAAAGRTFDYKWEAHGVLP
jgi:hypothetical protein